MMHFFTIAESSTPAGPVWAPALLASSSNNPRVTNFTQFRMSASLLICCNGRSSKGPASTRSVGGAGVARRRRRLVSRGRWTEELSEDRLQRIGPDLIAPQRRMQFVRIHHSLE